MTEFHEQAAAQHGLITRAQLLDGGIAASTISDWARQGRLRRVGVGVFAMPGSKSTDLQRLLSAVLAAGDGAVASHRAATWLWGLSDEPAMEVTVPRARRPRLCGVAVHRPGDDRPHRPSIRHCIPVTNPVRTLADLGSVAPVELVREAVERALAARLVSLGGLRREALVARGRGRQGPSVLAGVLAQRALTDRPPDSVFESRVAAFFRRHHLPKPVFQHAVRCDGRFLARVDFAYPEWLLAIEFDGHDAHRTPAQLQRDLTRQNLLVMAGWTVLRFTWADVVQRPEMVADTIRTKINALRQV